MNTRLLPPLLSRTHALFLDFDGTLAPIQNDPDSVSLTGGQISMISQIASELSGALAIVSGRGLADLSQRVPEDVWRVGSHGLEVCRAGEACTATSNAEAPASLAAAIEGVVAVHPGARLENKGEVLAVHYRVCPEYAASINAMIDEILRAHPHYKSQIGKCVTEAKPIRANKGIAIETLYSEAPFTGRQPIMIGDDATDEDAIRVVNALGGWCIKVGEGETYARYRVSSPQGVWDWLGGGVK